MRGSPSPTIALTKCYFCNEDYEIIMSRRLTINPDPKIEEMNGKVIDMSPCPKCQELMKKGIILITFDPAKSEPEWYKSKMPNPYRTGGWFVVTEDGFKRMVNNKGLVDYALKARWLFIEHEVAVRVGLFDAMEKSNDPQPGNADSLPA